MAAAAVSSCTLVSRGWLSAQSAVIVGNSSTGSSKSLVWDPLHGRHGMLRTSFGLSRELITETRRTTSGLRLAAPRASIREEDEVVVEQMMTESTEIVREEDSDKLHYSSNVEKSSETSQNVWWPRILTSAAKPAVVAVMMALLLTQPIEDSLAAISGGRMGGKSFSAPSRPSAPSRSYSGGGGGGGGGGARGYSGGGGVYVAPPIYGSPYGFSPFGYSPFYGGGYGGGGLFLGPSVGFGGGGIIILAMIAFATLRAVVGFVRDRFRGDDDDRFDD